MDQEKTEGPWRLSCGHSVATKNQPHYCRYISVQELMQLLTPNAGAEDERWFAHPDEHLFIVVHQMMELGFEQAVHTLRQCITAVSKEECELAIHLLERMTSWFQLFSRLTSMLKTMKTEDFFVFRPLLNGTSGAESLGFRRLEILSGRTPESPYTAGKTYREVLDRKVGTAPGEAPSSWWTPELARLTKECSLAAAWRNLLEKRSISDSAVASLPIEDVVRRLARSLYHYDRSFFGFYRTHLDVAAFHIGRNPGTGQTAGTRYLEEVLKNFPFFPELWPKNNTTKSPSQES